MVRAGHFSFAGGPACLQAAAQKPDRREPGLLACKVSSKPYSIDNKGNDQYQD